MWPFNKEEKKEREVEVLEFRIWELERDLSQLKKIYEEFSLFNNFVVSVGGTIFNENSQLVTKIYEKEVSYQEFLDIMFNNNFRLYISESEHYKEFKYVNNLLFQDNLKRELDIKKLLCSIEQRNQAILKEKDKEIEKLKEENRKLKEENRKLKEENSDDFFKNLSKNCK